MNIFTPFCAKNGFASAPSNIAIQYNEPETVEAFGLDNYNKFLLQCIIDMDCGSVSISPPTGFSVFSVSPWL
jgi:hypothetical protein